MKDITLRPVEPDMDFAQLAKWFSLIEDEPSTEASLKEYYQKEGDRITTQVAVNAQGTRLGFSWLARHRFKPGEFSFSLFVQEGIRRQGVGTRLYAEMQHTAQKLGAKKLQVSLWDDSPQDWAFAERRGFEVGGHQFMMALDLTRFDDIPYEAVIARLQAEGFQFTSMEALGNTEEAQRRLYALNDSTAATTPGSEGEHTWESFEDFQQRVVGAAWYKPDGQMVVIDTATGEWVAMSAITRVEGNTYAYNLFTGVDVGYRGRKLGQAVKVSALRYARQALGVTEVRTHHNAKNLPMITIDRKLGYVQLRGTYWMEKVLA